MPPQTPVGAPHPLVVDLHQIASSNATVHSFFKTRQPSWVALSTSTSTPSTRFANPRRNVYYTAGTVATTNAPSQNTQPPLAARPHFPATRFYQALKSLIVGPSSVAPTNTIREFHFALTKEQYKLRSTISKSLRELLPSAQYFDGSL
ncbi:hypothetical protein B0T26DRAFT_680626 [Lasiosphaeria miniovina]|uniref:Uncharacterized protein n=1 Tax=Lasiosphaeria miniovina TaxID=1954250 RepID=A0AA40A0J9_9PEZI|nr:uncharacterized protein B0T26DRAFT_680626 [Lasiosphaeria miniovina]KAK0707050.1 hypothetical protein B0T26DRAFT_680626 [Lasiosphaeria miniovina]